MAAGDPVDDEFDLLRDAPGPTPPPRRPLWLLLGAVVLVALLAVVGVFWMVSSVSDRGGRVTAAAVSSPAAPTTSEPVVTTVPPLPSTTAATPTATATVVPARTVVPSPTPKPTTAPAPKPTPTPLPRPTLSRPAGKVVAVPDVIGLRIKAATSVLQGVGLKVQVLGGVLVVDRDERRVTAQRPTPGTVVRAGSTVILVTDGI
jgi:hypothetical protein